jgi:hypothetical protein
MALVIVLTAFAAFVVGLWLWVRRSKPPDELPPPQ